mmetsp:Transcript_7587/g.8286  ORF Transcript_7587/g.8286 Transcript_7587/m.8286 type:complete len:138 (-) Transcript_7587:190-603(-)
METIRNTVTPVVDAFSNRNINVGGRLSRLRSYYPDNKAIEALDSQYSLFSRESLLSLAAGIPLVALRKYNIWRKLWVAGRTGQVYTRYLNYNQPKNVAVLLAPFVLYRLHTQNRIVQLTDRYWNIHLNRIEAGIYPQ